MQLRGLSAGITARDVAFWGLLAWGPLSALAYPFLRVGDPAWVTFDRVWIAAIGLWALWDLRRTRQRSRPGDAVVLTAALLVVSFGLRAGLTSEDRLTVIKVWFDAIVLPVILLVAARQLIAGAREWRLLLISLAIAGAVLSLIGWAEFAFDFELATRSGGTPLLDHAIGIVRVSGPYPATEMYALALLSCYAATLCWRRVSGASLLSIATAVALLELSALVITFYRAAWIAALLITAISFAYRLRTRPRPAVLVAIVAALLLVGFGLSRFDAVSTRVSNSENVVGRLATWGQDLNVFATAPVVGVGVERFTASTNDETNVEVSDVNALDQPHSSYLGLLAEQGVIGLLPFLALTVAVWWLIRSLRKLGSSEDDRALWSCVAGAGLAYLLMSLTLTMLPYGPSNAFFALLVGGAAAHLDRLVAEAP
jgi:O-antigen ligase